MVGILNVWGGFVVCAVVRVVVFVCEHWVMPCSGQVVGGTCVVGVCG